MTRDRWRSKAGKVDVLRWGLLPFWAKHLKIGGRIDCTIPKSRRHPGVLRSHRTAKYGGSEILAEGAAIL